MRLNKQEIAGFIARWLSSTLNSVA
jgi:hypothetical protein